MLLEIITPIIISLSGPGCTYVATPINQTKIQTVGDRNITFGVKEEVEEILSNKGIVLCDSGDVKIDVAINKIESPQEIVNIMGIQWLKKDYIVETEIIKEGTSYKGVGIKKTFATKRKYYWELLGEITQLQLLTRAEQFTNGVPPSWYLGSNLRQGYTNDGQLLGAGVGPGGSAQFVEFNWRKNKNRVGLAVERREHNSDFYEYTFEGSQDFRRFYVDFSSTIKVDWKYKKWLFGPRLSYIMTNNYNWWLFQANDIYFVNGKDVQQFALQFNFKYQL